MQRKFLKANIKQQAPHKCYVYTKHIQVRRLSLGRSRGDPATYEHQERLSLPQGGKHIREFNPNSTGNGTTGRSCEVQP